MSRDKEHKARLAYRGEADTPPPTASAHKDLSKYAYEMGKIRRRTLKPLRDKFFKDAQTQDRTNMSARAKDIFEKHFESSHSWIDSLELVAKVLSETLERVNAKREIDAPLMIAKMIGEYFTTLQVVHKAVVVEDVREVATLRQTIEGSLKILNKNQDQITQKLRTKGKSGLADAYLGFVRSTSVLLFEIREGISSKNMSSGIAGYGLNIISVESPALYTLDSRQPITTQTALDHYYAVFNKYVSIAQSPNPDSVENFMDFWQLVNTDVPGADPRILNFRAANSGFGEATLLELFQQDDVEVFGLQVLEKMCTHGDIFRESIFLQIFFFDFPIQQVDWSLSDDQRMIVSKVILFQHWILENLVRRVAHQHEATPGFAEVFDRFVAHLPVSEQFRMARSLAIASRFAQFHAGQILDNSELSDRTATGITSSVKRKSQFVDRFMSRIPRQAQLRGDDVFEVDTERELRAVATQLVSEKDVSLDADVHSFYRLFLSMFDRDLTKESGQSLQKDIEKKLGKNYVDSLDERQDDVEAVVSQLLADLQAMPSHFGLTPGVAVEIQYVAGDFARLLGFRALRLYPDSSLNMTYFALETEHEASRVTGRIDRQGQVHELSADMSEKRPILQLFLRYILQATYLDYTKLKMIEKDENGLHRLLAKVILSEDLDEGLVQEENDPEETQLSHRRKPTRLTRKRVVHVGQEPVSVDTRMLAVISQEYDKEYSGKVTYVEVSAFPRVLGSWNSKCREKYNQVRGIITNPNLNLNMDEALVDEHIKAKIGELVEHIKEHLRPVNRDRLADVDEDTQKGMMVMIPLRSSWLAGGNESVPLTDEDRNVFIFKTWVKGHTRPRLPDGVDASTLLNRHRFMSAAIHVPNILRVLWEDDMTST